MDCWLIDLFSLHFVTISSIIFLICLCLLILFVLLTRVWEFVLFFDVSWFCSVDCHNGLVCYGCVLLIVGCLVALFCFWIKIFFKYKLMGVNHVLDRINLNWRPTNDISAFTLSSTRCLELIFDRIYIAFISRKFYPQYLFSRFCSLFMSLNHVSSIL